MTYTQQWKEKNKSSMMLLTGCIPSYAGTIDVNGFKIQKKCGKLDLQWVSPTA